MITVKFDDGPLAGQTREWPVDVAPVEAFVATTGEIDTGPMSTVGKQRYVLHFVDEKRGVVHYYVPSGGR